MAAKRKKAAKRKGSAARAAATKVLSVGRRVLKKGYRYAKGGRIVKARAKR